MSHFSVKFYVLTFFLLKPYSVCVVCHDNDLSFMIAKSAKARIITWQFIYFLDKLIFFMLYVNNLIFDGLQ